MTILWLNGYIEHDILNVEQEKTQAGFGLWLMVGDKEKDNCKEDIRFLYLQLYDEH